MKMEQRATYSRCFPVFEAFASSVENVLACFASQVEEVRSRMRQYVGSPVALLATA